MPGPTFTVDSVLIHGGGELYDNPFRALLNLLYRELHGNDNKATQASIQVYTVLNSFALVANLLCLGVRIYRRDGKFFKLVATSRGTYIIPNVVFNFLVFNCIFIILCYPFVWRGLSIDSLENRPLWLTLVFIPLYFALWTVAWGTTVTAILQRSKSHDIKQGSEIGEDNWRCIWSLPWILNCYFIVLGAAAPAVMTAITIGPTQKFNRGVAAFREYETLLRAESAAFTLESGTAATIIAALPQSNSLLQTMGDNLYKFHKPSHACMTFSAVTALTMLIASFMQITYLQGQMTELKRSPFSETPSRNLSSSDRRTLAEIKERRAGIIRVMSNVVLMSIALCLSMIGYLVTCILKAPRISQSPIFMLEQEERLHSYVVLFLIGSINLFVTGVIVVQTFDTDAKVASGTTSGSGSKESERTMVSMNSYTKHLPKADEVSQSAHYGAPGTPLNPMANMRLNSPMPMPASPVPTTRSMGSMGGGTVFSVGTMATYPSRFIPEIVDEDEGRRSVAVSEDSQHQPDKERMSYMSWQSFSLPIHKYYPSYSHADSHSVRSSVIPSPEAGKTSHSPHPPSSNC